MLMSEQKGVYITDALQMADVPDIQDDMHEIRDEAPHNHFTSIPNMVDDMNLSPYAFRLYAHLKRVAGDLGACWQSTNTLAAACLMSAGMVSKSKQELTEKKLIHIERKHKPDGDWYHEVKIIDIWLQNSRAYSPHEGAYSYSENGSSLHESKKNPIKKNQILNTTTRKNSEVFKAYENEIGLITPKIADAIGDYMDDLHIQPDWIIEAIHLAATNNKRNWAYCAAILKRWAVEGKTALPPKQTPSGPKYPHEKTFAERVMEA
jgi:DnaD/phage-associated family protein